MDRRNPHVVIFMDVKDETGKVVTCLKTPVSASCPGRLQPQYAKIGQEITAVAIRPPTVLPRLSSSKLFSAFRKSCGGADNPVDFTVTMRSLHHTHNSYLRSVRCWQASRTQGDKDKFKARYEANAGSKEFDPHDFSGIWEMTRLDHSFGTPPPPSTPAGTAAMAGRIVDKPGVIGNAPWYTCNPMGFPRLMNDDEPMESL